MQFIGLTGGIGSGKSMVARILKQMGYPVYIADAEASRLINTHPRIREEMVLHFGNTIYSETGTLNKTLLADIIFKDPQALQKVNSIVHPCVINDFQEWSNKQICPCVFFESAILFEAHLDSFFDSIICITASEETRLARIVQRDQTTKEKIQERIRNQWNEAEKCRRSDFIIYNDDEHFVIEQIITILENLEIKKIWQNTENGSEQA